MAEKSNDPTRPYTEIDCNTEMDETFIGDNIYRLKNSKEDTQACLVRIPTQTRITLKPVRIHSDETYVRIIAGSSNVFMPLASQKIYQKDFASYGPWHVPCDHSYLVFASKSALEEVLEFTISPENEADKDDPNQHYCSADGVNYAAMNNY
ncbi:hypothetical protein Ddc_05070 [Ditylenchus destructor]|nr:hypothetical protein Ddc_05070 [Ditylenchus destructor]